MNTSIFDLYGDRVRVRVMGVCIKDDALLLIKHTGLGNKRMLWSPPGGGVIKGETAHLTLKREFTEETGLEIEVEQFLFANEYLKNPLHAIELFFKVRVAGGVLKKGTDPELDINDQIIEELKYVTFKDLAVMDNEILHNCLHDVINKESLLNMSGYFQFSE